MDLFRATEVNQGIRASVTGSGRISLVYTFRPITMNETCLRFFNRTTRTCVIPPGIVASSRSVTMPAPSPETNFVPLRVITRIIFSDKAYGPSPDSFTSRLNGLNCTGRPRCAVRPVIASAAVGS
jgi:hypothetical protein